MMINDEPMQLDGVIHSPNIALAINSPKTIVVPLNI